MQVLVKLSDIVEAMDLQTEELSPYLNRKTGTVVTVSNEDFRAAEEGGSLEEYPERQHELIQAAREILEDDEGIYIRLPTKFHIDEWQIMDDFAHWVKDGRISEELVYALRGRGAFRRFKDAIHRLGVAEDWYKYKDQALREIAIEWCEAHGIPFPED